eukprot:CAMPEP_0184499516 /NCGR_PEP_ID=MMETSP0113_2-20130426/41672_1 /TAXON_ID=91329 /ORGANISM="Norrisiella sphaerica, Strain BC52" /LENGTH=317 /DNA_ID=CAMNT_0026887439 /DNA_START=366 /DNA_END=1319 /DNA_ORIENTATION=-
MVRLRQRDVLVHSSYRRSQSIGGCINEPCSMSQRMRRKNGLGNSREKAWTARGWAGNVERVPHSEEIDADGVLTKFDPGTVMYISLNNKNIQDIPPGTFEGAEKARMLDLDANKISVLKAGTFQGLSKLEELKLSGNIIQTIEPGAFAGMPNLKSLYLSRNPISELKEGVFEGLKNLTSLTLHSAPLKEINPLAFAPLANLKKLHMYNTDIDEIPEGLFTYLPNLQVLSIHMCNVKKLPSNFLQPMSELEELSVDGPSMPIENAVLFASQPKLRFVYLFGSTTEEIFLAVRKGLADASNCKVVVQENPNIGPGYSYT